MPVLDYILKDRRQFQNIFIYCNIKRQIVGGTDLVLFRMFMIIKQKLCGSLTVVAYLPGVEEIKLTGAG